jgi:hypothetical protein
MVEPPGVTLSRKFFNLDLRYYDTNLSKEDRFVFTGDPDATPGSRPNPITNPDGLVSRWCSATFVAKFWFAFNSRAPGSALAETVRIECHSAAKIKPLESSVRAIRRCSDLFHFLGRAARASC